MTETTEREAFNAKVSSVAKEKYGADGDFDSLSSEQQQEILTQVASGKVIKAGIGTADFESEEKSEKVPLEEQVKSGLGYKIDKWIDPESKGGAPLGKMVKDPVSGKKDFAQNIAVNVKENPYKYAKKGIIPTNEWPWFKEVSVKEALMNWRESKKESMDLSQPREVAPQPISLTE